MEMHYFLLVACLFAPGYLIVRIFSIRTRIYLTKLETLLASVIISTSLLVFPSTVALLTVPRYDMTSHFYIFVGITIASIGSILFSHRLVIKRSLLLVTRLNKTLASEILRKTIQLLPKDNLRQISMLCIVSLTLGYSVVSISYPIQYQWDVTRYYLPYSKLMLADSALPHYPLLSLYSVNEPLSILVVYAFAEFMDSSFVVIPIIFFICLLIGIYLFAKELTNSKIIGIISVTIFTMLPYSELYMSYRSLYLDLYIFAFMLAAFYFVQKSIGNTKYLWPILFGLSFSLMASSRLIAIAYALVVLQYLLVNITRNKKMHLMSVSLILILLLGPINKFNTSTFLVEDLERIVIIATGFVTSVVLLISNKSINMQNIVISSRFILSILISSSAGLIWYIHNSLVNGSPFFPFLIFKNGQFDDIYINQVRDIFPQSISHGDVFVGLAQFPLLGSFGLIPVLFSIVGITFVAEKKEISHRFLPIFISLLIIWAITDKGSTDVLMSRHLGALAVFISITAAMGLYHISRNKDYGINSLNTLFLVFVMSFLVMKIVFPVTVKSESILWNFKETQAVLPLEYIIISLTIVSLMIFVPSLWRMRLAVQITRRYFVVTPVFVLILAQPAFATTFHSDSSINEDWEYNYTQIIEFYNQNLLDRNQLTITPIDYLTYFTPYRAVDVGTAPGIVSLKLLSQAPVCDTLRNNNIKYFLEPKKETGNLFTLYKRMQEHNEVMKNLNESLVLLKEFEKFKLYEINCKSIDLLSIKPIPWNYDSLSFFDHTSKMVHVEGYPNKSGRYSILFPIENSEELERAARLDVGMIAEPSGKSFVMLKLRNGTWFTPDHIDALRYNQTEKLVINVSKMDFSEV